MILFVVFRDFIRRLYFARLRVETALLFDLVVALLQIAGVVGLYLSGRLSVYLICWVIGSASGAAAVVWLFLHRGTFRTELGRALSDLRRNWAFGKWVFASGVVWNLSMNVYPWLLTAFQGTASTGVWAACIGVTALANPPLMGMQNFLGPKIATVYAERGARAAHRFALRSSVLLAVVTGFLCFALFLLGGPLLVLIYGSKYAGNGTVVSLLSLNLAVVTVAFPFSRALFAIERADIDFKINLIPLLALFTLGIWLVRSLGPVGAALALLVANLAASCVRWFYLTLLSRPSSRRTA